MSDSSEHLAHAKHNLEFLKSFIESKKFNDWTITVSFYTAVHLVEYAIAKLGQLTYCGKTLTKIHHSNQLPSVAASCGIGRPEGLVVDTKSQHELRNILVNGTDELKGVSENYILLYKKSRVSRYQQYKWQDGEIDMFIKYAANPVFKWFDDNFKTKLTL